MSSSIAVPQPQSPTQHRVRSRTAIWLGGAVATVGAIIAVAGSAVLIVFGSDGRIASGNHDVSTGSSALVSGTASIKNITDVDAVVRPRIQVSAASGDAHGVFVGIARTSDVDRYLAGAPVATVTDFDIDPWRLTRTTRPGDAVLAAPSAQSFWVARSSGAKASIDWKLRDGDYRVVVMNADGTRGVNADASFGVKVPYVTPVAAGIGGIGIALLIAGIAVIAFGARRRQD